MNRTSQADAARALADLLTTHPQLDGNVYCPIYHNGRVTIQVTNHHGAEKRDSLFGYLVRIFDGYAEVELSPPSGAAWRTFSGLSNGVRFEVTAHYDKAEAALLHEQARSKHAEAAAAREVNEANAATDSQPFGSVAAEVA